MLVRHPNALDEDGPDPDDAVHYGSRREVAEVDDDGTFEVPDGQAESFLESWPAAEGYDPEELLVGGGDDEGDETAESAASDGASDDETCGYYDPEEMDSPCSRPAGWGRDADDGPCQDHVDNED